MSLLCSKEYSISISFSGFRTVKLLSAEVGIFRGSKPLSFSRYYSGRYKLCSVRAAFLGRFNQVNQSIQFINANPGISFLSSTHAEYLCSKWTRSSVCPIGPSSQKTFSIDQWINQDLSKPNPLPQGSKVTFDIQPHGHLNFPSFYGSLFRPWSKAQ